MKVRWAVPKDLAFSGELGTLNIGVPETLPSKVILRCRLEVALARYLHAGECCGIIGQRIRAG